MAIITFLAVVVLVAILIKLTLERREDYQADEKTEMQDKDRGKEIKVPSSDLGQPSCQTEISEIHNPPNLPAECLQNNLQEQLTEEKERADQISIEQGIGMVQRLALQTAAAEGQAENMKNGVKVACLVISVSSTGIISFLAGVPGRHSSMTRMLISKSGILLMFASFFSALVLLMLSTNNAKFSCSNQTLRIMIWMSTGLMTLAVVLLLTVCLGIT
ncbi:hypothetical protein SLEP1_g45129 [Rubroshorea leprosula]|uniref:Uncharacterized protein n=1 Tax=Rubroshorea leprosula TaxID=152421 RepID=A0AAV5LJR2_9ROSI|nr:hypothetical protein SLEP1_g45129 [Rubroshorea leprosula]